MPRKGKSKKENNDKSSFHEQILSRQTLRLHIAVCGEPQVIDLFTRKRSDLKVLVDKYQVSIYVDPGNDESGKMVAKDSDFFLCVYDICNRKSVDFLKNKVLDEVKDLKKPMGVAGLGLEYRTNGGKELVEVGTAAALAKKYGCKGAELISCDGGQLAAGTFCLYALTKPEQFDIDLGEEEETESGGGKKSKKNKKKSKKEKI